MDMPSVPFTEDVDLPVIPQKNEDGKFAHKDIREGLQGRIYKEVTENYAQARVTEGLVVSSSFEVSQGGKQGRDVS